MMKNRVFLAITALVLAVIACSTAASPGPAPVSNTSTQAAQPMISVTQTASPTLSAIANTSGTIANTSGEALPTLQDAANTSGAAAPTLHKVTARIALHIRDGAGVNNKILGWLWHGAEVGVVKCESNGWAQIVWTNSGNAWVNADYLSPGCH